MDSIFHRVSIRKFQDKPVEPEKIEKLLRAAKNAPVLIVSAYREDVIFPMYAQIDLSIANENLWLETDALGLGGVWLGIAPIEERMHEVESVLQMPAGHHAFAIFALGYPAESKPQQDRFDPARIHYAE